MTRPSMFDNERIVELLCERATQGLTAAEELELETLLSAYPGQDAEALDRVAGAMTVGVLQQHSRPLPPALREKLLRDSQPFVTNPTAPAGKSALRSLKWLAASGWIAAAAAMILAVAGWWQSLSPAPLAPTLGAQYRTFAAQSPDLVQAEWKGQTEGFETVRGEVLWSSIGQRGYLRLLGLPQNNPYALQYQIWIGDSKRGANPIHAGVFDADCTGEVIVPIRPSLPIDVPEYFAITREKAGGVAVPESSPVLVAKPRT